MNTTFKGNDRASASATVATTAASGEVLHRVAARAAVAVDAALAANGAREAARLAAKYGPRSTVALEAAARAAELAETHALSVAAAQRAEVPVVVPAEGKALIQGRVVDELGHGRKGLTVIARVGDHEVATTTSEADGVFRIDVKPDGGDPKGGKRVLAQVDDAKTPAPRAVVELTLEVRKGEHVVLRDETPIKLAAGHTVYRELVIGEK